MPIIYTSCEATRGAARSCAGKQLHLESLSSVKQAAAVADWHGQPQPLLHMVQTACVSSDFLFCEMANEAALAVYCRTACTSRSRRPAPLTVWHHGFLPFAQLEAHETISTRSDALPCYMRFVFGPLSHVSYELLCMILMPGSWQQMSEAAFIYSMQPPSATSECDIRQTALNQAARGMSECCGMSAASRRSLWQLQPRSTSSAASQPVMAAAASRSSTSQSNDVTAAAPPAPGCACATACLCGRRWPAALKRPFCRRIQLCRCIHLLAGCYGLCTFGVQTAHIVLSSHFFLSSGSGPGQGGWPGGA